MDCLLTYIPKKVPKEFQSLLASIKRKLKRKDLTKQMSWFDDICSDESKIDSRNSLQESLNRRFVFFLYESYSMI